MIYHMFFVSDRVLALAGNSCQFGIGRIPGRPAPFSPRSVQTSSMTAGNPTWGGFVGVAALSASLVFVSYARADPSPTDRNLAQTLFDQARELMGAGKYNEACAKFAESQRLDPGGGTLLNLALCHEKQGKIATAWADFHEALSAALRDRRKEREKLAREHLQTLEPRLPKLTLQVAQPVATAMELKIDGAPVARTAWGAAVPIDPASHVIQATAPGKKPWSATFTMREAEQRTTSVPLLDDEPQAPAAAASAARPRTNDVEERPSSRPRTGAYVAGGFGVLGLGVGTYFGLHAIAERKEADSYCSETTCKREGFDHNENAVRDAWISDAAFGIGLIGVGLAVYWMVVPDSSSTRSTTGSTWTVAPSVAARGGGVTVGSRW